MGENKGFLFEDSAGELLDISKSSKLPGLASLVVDRQVPFAGPAYMEFFSG
jgi:hypothetical protein